MRVIIISKVLQDAGNKQSSFQRLNEGSWHKACFMVAKRQCLAAHANAKCSQGCDCSDGDTLSQWREKVSEFSSHTDVGRERTVQM